MDSRPSFNISNNVAYANSQQIITAYYDPNGHNASVQACLRALDCPDVDAVRTEIHSLDGVIPECIAWIFQDDRFLQWKEQEGNAILWIYGSPGKGKTRMAAGIVDKLRKETGSTGVNGLTGFFFCRSTDYRMNNAVDVLKGIIRTLWEQRQSFKEHVHHHWIKEEQKFNKDLNQVASLWNLLEKMTKDIGHQATYIVIDAIDECSEQVEHLLRLIHTAGLVSPPNVKWLITSRPSSLDLQGSIWSYHRPMQIDLDSFTVQVDDAVQRYIRVKTAWMELSRFSVDDQARICKLLLTKSESTFLWVAFVCQEVRNLPASEVIRVISAMPERLHRLYEKNMQLLDEACRDSNEFAIEHRKLVWTLYNLSGSPHLLELAVLAGLPTGNASDESYLIRVIRECNTFMVLTDNDAVMLVHKSVKDYLDELQPEMLRMFRLPSQNSIAKQCITILQRSLRKNIAELCELDSEAKGARLELRTRFSSTAGYSCLHWIEHIIKARVPSPNAIHGFLRQHLLHWLEAISILGRYRLGLNQLVQLDFALKAISKDQDNTLLSALPFTSNATRAELHNFVRSARDFATTSSNMIERWPLQVYYSALIFFASANDLDEVFDAGKPNWILQRLISEAHVWHPKPHVTIEYELRRDLGKEPDIALSKNGEFLVALWPNLGVIRFWRLEDPDRFLEHSCAKSFDVVSTMELKVVIEGNVVKAVWMERRSSPPVLNELNGYMFRWKSWEVDSGEPTGEGVSPITVTTFNDPYAFLKSFGFDQRLVFPDPQGVVDMSFPKQCCFCSDGRLLAIYDRTEKNIQVYLTSNGEELLVFSLKGSVPQYATPDGLRFCCDDKMVIFAARDRDRHKQFFVMCNIRKSEVLVRSIDVCEPDGWRSIGVREFRERINRRWATDEDGRYLACDTGCEIHVLEIATNRLLQIILGNMASPRALSTDPLLVAAVANDGTIRVWDIERARQLDPTPQFYNPDESLIDHEVEEGRQHDYDAHYWLPSPDNKKMIRLYARTVESERSTCSDRPALLVDLDDWGALLAYTFSPDSTMFMACVRGPSAVDLYLKGYFGSRTTSSSGIADRFNLDCSTRDGVYLAVFSFSSSHDHPRFLDHWTIELYPKPTERTFLPASVAVGFSQDQSLLLYSIPLMVRTTLATREFPIVLGMINIHDRKHEECFTFTLPEHQAYAESHHPQAICASGDHSLIAISSYIDDLIKLRSYYGRESSNLFVFRESTHRFSAVGFEGQDVRLLKFSDSSELLVAVSEEGHIKVFRLPKYPPALSETIDEAPQNLDLVDQIPSRGQISELEFSADGRSLETNLGPIHLFQNRESIIAPTITGLYLDDHWICVQGKRLVYLPPEYRPESPKRSRFREDCLYNFGFIIQNPCVWIMTRSWCFVKIEFDPDLIRRLIRDHELV